MKRGIKIIAARPIIIAKIMLPELMPKLVLLLVP